MSAAYCETAGHTWRGTVCTMCGEIRERDAVGSGLTLTRGEWKLVMRALGAFARSERNRMARIRAGRVRRPTASEQGRLLADVAELHGKVTDHVEGKGRP